MYIKIIRQDRQQFMLGGSINDDAEWGIIKISGIGEYQNMMDTVVPAVRDGVDITHERVNARYIDITASVKRRREGATERRRALSFFNPKYEYTVYITKDEVTRWIPARIEQFQCPEQKAENHVSINLSLICADPYFYSVNNFGKDIAAITGCFGFPYISPITRGFRVGVYNFAKLVEIENQGDVETYARVVIKADGVVVNPKIMQNGAFIRLIDQLTAGDEVEMDMVNNTVKKNGNNCIAKMDRRSSFSGMALQLGNNEITFDADNGDVNMTVTVFYHHRYTGV